MAIKITTSTLIKIVLIFIVSIVFGSWQIDNKQEEYEASLQKMNYEEYIADYENYKSDVKRKPHSPELRFFSTVLVFYGIFGAYELCTFIIFLISARFLDRSPKSSSGTSHWL
ncbi:MAG: hypothetical protein ABJH72_04420 [Reichenbachiella sp.]|uniref:hypothetical protein n=1 Tax=Reichenbachiella sp. TaxID=2184521 RepID=UPI003299A608